MGIFDKRAKKEETNSQKQSTGSSYVMKKYFGVSRPYGYNPEEVDKSIDKFNSVLTKQKAVIMKLKEENSSLKNEISKLENELKEMQVQLSFATIPSVNSIQQEYILQEFDKAFQSQPLKNQTQVSMFNGESIGSGAISIPQSEETLNNDEEVFEINSFMKKQEKDDLEVFSGDSYQGECAIEIPGLDFEDEKPANSQNDNESPEDFFKKFKF